MQVTCPLPATPRGSKPTTSKRLATSAGNLLTTELTKSAAEPPGPPGLTNNEPIRCVKSVARWRFKLNEREPLPRFRQSRGTWAVAHWKPLSLLVQSFQDKEGT